MYITISPQKLGDNYLQSATDFVAYLEKENQEKSLDDMEHFFTQDEGNVSEKQVVSEIDRNTAKLKKREPKFYSITINPSQRELHHLQQSSKDLKAYTRELMKTYANAFNREIDGRKVGVNDLLYFAKVEHERTYKGTDKIIQANQPYIARVARLENEVRMIARGELSGSIHTKQREIQKLKQTAPHQLNGKMIVRGMAKEGSQSHIHIIISRKDKSNRYSLSPGSKYKASETVFNGKIVKRGFDRDTFFKNSEQVFDKLFHYKRNYVETYNARKTFIKNPEQYFKSILGLSSSEKGIAFRLLQKSGVKLPMTSIPINQTQLALKVLGQLKKGVKKAIESGSIGI